MNMAEMSRCATSPNNAAHSIHASELLGFLNLHTDHSMTFTIRAANHGCFGSCTGARRVMAPSSGKRMQHV